MPIQIIRRPTPARKDERTVEQPTLLPTFLILPDRFHGRHKFYERQEISQTETGPDRSASGLCVMGPGDKVNAGDMVLVVESDKADMDVESYEEG